MDDKRSLLFCSILMYVFETMIENLMSDVDLLSKAIS